MITGKDVYAIACAHLLEEKVEPVDFEKAIPWVRDYYNDLAQKLNEQFLTPLLGLVKNKALIGEEK